MGGRTLAATMGMEPWWDNLCAGVNLGLVGPGVKLRKLFRAKKFSQRILE
jgi:hypothetical protein